MLKKILKLFKIKRPLELQKRADMLLNAVQIQAITLREPLGEKYTFVYECQLNDWILFVGVACFFLAASRLRASGLSRSEQESLAVYIFDKLEKWEPSAGACFDRTKEIFEAEYLRLKKLKRDENFIGADAIGMAIAVNILRRAPSTKTEFEFVRASGVAAIHAFHSWWIV